MSADDVFVSFVETARRMLLAFLQKELQERSQAHVPTWSWVCSRIVSCCKAYPSGVTSTILLSELYESWLEKVRNERCKGRSGVNSGNAEAYQLRKQKQILGTKVTTIDFILERKFVSLEAVLDVIIIDIKLLRGPTPSYLLTLGDAWSVNTIEFFLHSKFSDLVDGSQAILKKSRELRLTGCRLSSSQGQGLWGSGPFRLLPTELMVVLLDEEQEEDVVLLGAKFCNDYFSGIQLSDIKAKMDYHFYAKVEGIEIMGLQGQQEQVKHHRITLRDDNGDLLPLFLWNDQVSLSSMLSKGSMVAIERPSILYEFESDNCTISRLWFEYQSLTRLYSVPYVPSLEETTAEAAQVQSNLAELSVLKSVEKGQRILIGNVRSKMTDLALYGLVTHLSRVPHVGSVINSNSGVYKAAFLLRIGDNTGVLDINLYMIDYWSAGEIHVGQMVFISGIVVSTGVHGELECSWTEKGRGVMLVNMTQLPTLLSTSCLHRTVPLSKISSSSLTVQVCKVHTGSLVVGQGVQVKYCHVLCGRPVIAQAIPNIWRCDFCARMCDNNETTLTFFLTALLLDAYPGQRTQVYATCSGQAAREVMQAEPEVFCSMSEVDKGMHIYTRENDLFLVTLYSGLQDDMGTFQNAQSNVGPARGTCLRIGQALKTSPD